MILPQPKDAQHKLVMLRLLREILCNKDLRLCLQFKGGTYAALRGVLDRFSVDLDFDLPDKNKKKQVRQACYRIFDKLGFQIKDESKKYLQFFLRYEAKAGERNTIKLEINDKPSIKNTYEKIHLKEINMYCSGHTLGTMVANKLVASLARFEKTNKIAGRDFYDLWYFFLNGLPVNQAVVENSTKMSYVKYLDKVVEFLERRVTDKVLNQDLNPLLPVSVLNKTIQQIRPELLSLLKDEISRN